MTHEPVDPFPTLLLLGREFDQLSVRSDPARGRVSSRRFVVAVAAASLIALVVLSVSLAGPRGDAPLSVSEAQAKIDLLADHVGQDGDDLVLSPGQLLYQEEFRSPTGLVADLKGNVASAPVGGTTIQRWISRDGTTWSRDAGDGSGTPVKDRQGDGDFGPGEQFGLVGSLSYDDVLALPRSPDELASRLRELTPSGSSGLTAPLAGLLDLPLPLDLQAALLHAAAQVPSAQVEDHIKTPAGGEVTAIYFGGANGIRWELLFDPDTGSYRGRAVVLPSGHRYFASLILTRGVVNELGDTSGESGNRV
ncbi:MAG: hypothetical protein U0R24_00650 [Solirubrobacterales bacterium]